MGMWANSARSISFIYSSIAFCLLFKHESLWVMPYIHICHTVVWRSHFLPIQTFKLDDEKNQWKPNLHFSIFIKMNFQSLLLLYQHTVIWLIQFVISMYWKRIDSFVQVSWLKNSEKPWPWEYRKIDVPENWNSNNLM